MKLMDHATYISSCCIACSYFLIFYPVLLPVLLSNSQSLYILHWSLDRKRRFSCRLVQFRRSLLWNPILRIKGYTVWWEHTHKFTICCTSFKVYNDNFSFVITTQRNIPLITMVTADIGDIDKQKFHNKIHVAINDVNGESSRQKSNTAHASTTVTNKNSTFHEKHQ